MSPQKDILLTGASGIIGMAVARQLAREGFTLHLTARDLKKLEPLKRELSDQGKPVFTFLLDLSNAEQRKQAVKSFFQNSVTPFGMICNAGNMGTLGPFVDIDFDAWMRGINENFIAHAAMIHQFAAESKSKNIKAGAIVVLSGAGVGGDSKFENMTGYSTAKAAIVHLVEALSPELEALGLTINAVAPGPVLSGMTRQALDAGARAGVQAQRALECKTSGGVSPELAAQAVSFLMSDKARAISGRLLSARFDISTVQKDPAAMRNDSNLYRLRRIDNELFAPKPR